MKPMPAMQTVETRAVPDRAATIDPLQRALLDLELERLRLLLARRITWLRSHWRDDTLQPYGAQVISDLAADRLLQGGTPEDELRFRATDPHAVELSAALARIEACIAEQRAAVRERGAAVPIETLAALFALTPFECDVLRLCLAAEIDAAFEPLYAYVQDDVACKFPTAHLAAALFATGAQHAEGVCFDPEAPLRRYQLLVVEPGQGSRASTGARALRLDERIAALLLGSNRLDARVEALVRPLQPAPLAASQRAQVEQLARLIAAEERLQAINFVGPPGCGARAIAQTLGTHFGLNVVELDLARLPVAEPERRPLLRLLERESVLLNLGYYVNATALDWQERNATAVLEDVVERCGAFRVVATRERCPIGTLRVVSLQRPDAQARRELWQTSLGESAPALAASLDALAQQFELDPEAVLQSVQSARLRAQGGEAQASVLQMRDLWRAARDEAGRPLAELAQRIDPCNGWADLVLPEDALAQMREIAAQVAQRARVYDAWGFGAKLTRGRGIAALFAGPSGTGKTLAAEVLARELDLDLYRIDLSGVVSKYIGETEKNLRRVFDAAEASGSILFFDEADALFGKRSEVRDSHDRYANIEINYLLQRMEDYRGLAILATNLKSHLDAAFLRRLRFVVDLPFPDAELRRRLWQAVFPPDAPCEALDYQALARLDLAGGNIRTVALNAAFAAAAEGTPIGMRHVLQAARREYQKLDKLLAGTTLAPQVAGGRR
jgi:hypothetical protein